MSFDLYVWRNDRALSTAEAQRTYEALARGQLSLPQDRAIAEVAAELRWMLRGPVELLVTGGYLAITVPWDRADEIALTVRDLALEHGLTVYDPQNAAVVQPPR